MLVVLVALLVALGGLLSATPAGADIPPCWNTYDIDHRVVWTWGCADSPIGGPIGYIAICFDGCSITPICVYDPDTPPPSQPVLCGIV